MGCEPHVVLKVIEVVTHEVGNDMILLCQLVLQLLILTLKVMELLLKSLDLAELFSLHDHRIVHMVHRVIRLED